jgi:hypothetical protein
MIWVLLAVIVVLLIVIGLLVARQQRSRRLRDDFGPEYGRVVAARGDQRSAEQELARRRERVDQFEIRPLEPAARERYAERWLAVQRAFVDDPRGAVGEAHLLVQQVMHERGYPVDEDFDQRSADLSVKHPEVVENYRAAHVISVAAQKGKASTEQLRKSMVHFRALFDDLLAPQDGRSAVAGERSGARTEQTAVPHKPTRRR